VRALLSVANREGITTLARDLLALDVEVYATEGTREHLASDGIDVASVADLTDGQTTVGGQVKTFHHAVYAGILARRDVPGQMAELEAQGIIPIDLVIVNVKPFAPAVGVKLVGLDEAIEMIDVGGAALLGAAARNSAGVAAASDPTQYERIVGELREHGHVTPETRAQLAAEAFSMVAAYHAEIAAYLNQISGNTFPRRLAMVLEKVDDLRYGENPHQRAAFYADARSPLPRSPSGRPTIAAAEVLGGKQLSYNNLLDLDAALGLALEFTEPAAVIVKHNNPCGVAIDPDLAAAYRKARQADPISVFGGIVAVNREVDEPLAKLLADTFLECVVAPGYSAAALGVLAGKKNLRLVAAPGTWQPPTGELAWSLRTIAGGALVQHVDHGMVDLAAAKVATVRAPTASEHADLAFAWRVAKHVKSNAIVFARDGVTIAIGAGQMSRVDAVRICEHKAGERLEGAVVASDAFFPFRDGVDVLADAGAVAVVSPGGSVRDAEVIAAADEHGLAMLFTGMRHFRH
jgi:phosphoribosylaminoimidazolecarboxamide formyltransferase/IMP cyclohydrolase